MFPIEPVLEHYGATYVPEGRNRAMKCPFHDDAHASASVDTDKGLFNCHTCGVAGDAIALIQHVEGLGFRDAVARAKSIAGGEHGEVPGSSARDADSVLPSRKGDRPSRRGYRPSWQMRKPE